MTPIDIKPSPCVTQVQHRVNTGLQENVAPFRRRSQTQLFGRLVQYEYFLVIICTCSVFRSNVMLTGLLNPDRQCGFS